MIDTVFSEKVGRKIGAFGLLLLAVGLGLAAVLRSTSDIRDATSNECHNRLGEVSSTQAGDGSFQILGVTPDRTALNRIVCVVVAGVVPKAEEKPGSKAIVLKLFMNDAAATHVEVQAEPVAAPQMVTFRLTSPPSATSDGAAFWRDLLAGGRGSNSSDLRLGERKVAVGLSRTDASSPEATSTNPITLVVYDVWVFSVGVAAFVLLFLSFFSFARNSTLLRDNARTVGDYRAAAAAAQEAQEQAAETAREVEIALQTAQSALQGAERDLATAPADPAKQQVVADAKNQVQAAEGKLANAKQLADERTVARAKADQDLVGLGWLLDSKNSNMPTGPYSLAKTQIAFWLLLTIAGFMFIWFSVGQYFNLITTGVLVLLGINGVASFASMQMDDQKEGQSKTNSFLDDILNDGDGPKLHRFQAVAWTAILGVIFVWNVFWNFSFVEFDTNLLLLIGIAQSMYVGFKYQEKPGV